MGGSVPLKYLSPQSVTSNDPSSRPRLTEKGGEPKVGSTRYGVSADKNLVPREWVDIVKETR